MEVILFITIGLEFTLFFWRVVNNLSRFQGGPLESLGPDT